MRSFKEYLTEADSEEVRDAKKVFTALQGMYPKIPKFPLVFKNLKGRGSGYLETSKLKGGKVIFVDLAQQSFREAYLSRAVLQGFLRGRGANMVLLYNLLQDGLDALDFKVE